ncbi:unnamed protein product [Linum tenue]|uniref:65-kDa microtubule-associated protein 8 n=1 Tax=Linum tenue TaxID=586396 RepID=A0AAV0H7I1_9ROSI|nr:unnamed protein product [Linum tenue]
MRFMVPYRRYDLGFRGAGDDPAEVVYLSAPTVPISPVGCRVSSYKGEAVVAAADKGSRRIKHYWIGKPNFRINKIHRLLIGMGTRYGEIDHANLLMSMDEQISRAKEEASSRKAIMEKVEKLMLARDEERWLEEYSMDENRYSVSRGAHRNLRRAEKARILVNKIPDLLGSLVSKTKSWEEERKKVFLYDDVPLMAMIEEYNMVRLEKEDEKRRQKETKKVQIQVEPEPPFTSRPSTSSRRPSNRSLNGGLSYATPSNRKLSMSIQRLGSNSINYSATQAISYIKEGKKMQETKIPLPTHRGITPRFQDETASVLSTFSGPLSP